MPPYYFEYPPMQKTFTSMRSWQSKINDCQGKGYLLRASAVRNKAYNGLSPVLNCLHLSAWTVLGGEVRGVKFSITKWFRSQTVCAYVRYNKVTMWSFEGRNRRIPLSQRTLQLTKNRYNVILGSRTALIDHASLSVYKDNFSVSHLCKKSSHMQFYFAIDL